MINGITLPFRLEPQIKVARRVDDCYYSKVTLFKKPLRRKEQPKCVFCEHIPQIPTSHKKACRMPLILNYLLHFYKVRDVKANQRHTNLKYVFHDCLLKSVQIHMSHCSNFITCLIAYATYLRNSYSILLQSNHVILYFLNFAWPSLLLFLEKFLKTSETMRLLEGIEYTSSV